MDILNTTSAFAWWKERIFFWRIINPTEAAERKLFIKTFLINIFSHFKILFLFLRLTSDISHFPLLIGVHFCDLLFVVIHSVASISHGIICYISTSQKQLILLSTDMLFNRLVILKDKILALISVWLRDHKLALSISVPTIGIIVMSMERTLIHWIVLFLLDIFIRLLFRVLIEK